ncbi:hypothetical protein [Lachnotalea glycerini]|uniref:Head decoration protein n=1 Tax=Lachnotalea glycerini TaxID=1763509 RepID=A0A371J7B7_9FIRM|nr:hypothetical protein [Lachnotalea glycerini]RDY28649.1 hypothetical protein CG710_019265 [Lachnotalea glycerini]
MSLLNKDYGSVDYDNLVNRSGEVGSIQLAAGQGILAKGSVIDTTGMLLKNGATAAYILCDETETDDTETVIGIVYKNGNFVRNSLVVASEYTFTDADADNLRDVGIIVETAQ